MDHYERAYKFFLTSFLLNVVGIIFVFIFIGTLFSQFFVLYNDPMRLTSFLALLLTLFMPFMMGTSLIQVLILYSTVKTDIGVIGGDYGLDLSDHEKVVKFIKFLPWTIAISFVMIMLVYPLLYNPVASYGIIIFLTVPVLIVAIFVIIFGILSFIGQIFLAIYAHNIGRNSGITAIVIGGLLSISIFVGFLITAIGLRQLSKQ